MTLDRITTWAAAGESETLEFKKTTAERDRTCRTLCAFANGQCGRVLFGVTPAGKVVGQIANDHTLEELAQEFRGLEPPAVAVREGAVVVTFGLPATVTGKTTGKTTGKMTGKTPLAVLELLAEQPDLSIPELAARLDKSERAIERAIRKLRESGRLERIGPAKGGHWKVIG